MVHVSRSPISALVDLADGFWASNGLSVPVDMGDVLMQSDGSCQIRFHAESTRVTGFVLHPLVRNLRSHVGVLLLA